jgi:hypothetical protein
MILETLHDHIVCMLWSVFGIGFVCFLQAFNWKRKYGYYLCAMDT